MKKMSVTKAASQIASMLKLECKPALEALDPNALLFVNDPSGKTIKKITTDEQEDTLTEIFDVFKEEAERKNGVLATHDEPGNKVFIPIGEFTSVSHNDLSSPTDYDNADQKYYDLNEENKKVFQETQAGKLRDRFHKETTSRINEKWKTYLEGKANERRGSLPYDDPEFYDHNVTSVVNEWMAHYKSDIAEEIERAVENNSVQFDIDASELFLKELEENFLGYNTFNRERFIEGEMKNYVVNSFASANDVLVFCDKYYAIEPNFFNYFIKEKLWH